MLSAKPSTDIGGEWGASSPIRVETGEYNPAEMARLLLINAPHEGVNAGHHSRRKMLREAPNSLPSDRAGPRARGFEAMSVRVDMALIADR